jgi:hypothetical protein
MPTAPRQFCHEIAERRADYDIWVGGSLDEFNTADYPETYSKCHRLESGFQPNRFVAIENVGDCDVIDPRLTINGRRRWHDAEALLGSVLKPGMSAAAKALAIFGFSSSIEVQAHDNSRRVGLAYPGRGDEHHNTEPSHPSNNDFRERADPVRAANTYYCSGCSLSATNFVVLCRRAGLAARAIWMCPLDTFTTHCVAEAWYEGGWHLFDPECRAFYLREDNRTVASYQDLHRNPQLAERTHVCGFASRGGKSQAPDYREFYPPHVMAVEDWCDAMRMTLRPGATLLYRWSHEGKYRYGDNIRKRPELLPYQLANGKLRYRPRLDGTAYLTGIVADNNMETARTADGTAALRPIVSGQLAHVLYRVDCPWPMVGGAVGLRFTGTSERDRCRVRVSVKDRDWETLWEGAGAGAHAPRIALDACMDAINGPAIRTYYLRFELEASDREAGAWLEDICIESDLQMAATALPSLSVGLNQVSYCDCSPVAARVRITHGWEESGPAAVAFPPRAPTEPAVDQHVPAEGPAWLRWRPAADCEADSVRDYHVQISAQGDMATLLSPNFDRITFSPEPNWPVPAGWMRPDKDYFWRVRCRNRAGVWSDWSLTWRFQTAAK